MTHYPCGLDFLHDQLDTPSQREDRLSLERMHRDLKVINECQIRQHNGENVKLIRVLGEGYIIEVV